MAIFATLTPDESGWGGALKLWSQLRWPPSSLEFWVKEPQKKPGRHLAGAGSSCAGHPDIPPEVTVTPQFPPQEGGPA